MKKFREYLPALAAFFLMMSMALTTTALSFLVGPVCDELGFGRGSFTVYYSIMTAAGTLASPFLGQMIRRRGVETVVMVSAFWTAAGLLAFSCCRQLWMFYLVGGLTGLFGTACVTLCAGVIVQTRYRGAQASRLTGIVMAGSGVGGMIVSMVLPGLLRAFGWRTCCRLTGLAWLTLGLCAVCLLCGASQSIAAGERGTDSRGMSRTQALRSPGFLLLVPVIFLLSAASGVQQQLPSVLADLGWDSVRCSAGMSCFTAVLALGKIGQGLLYGKTGPKTGGFLMILCYIAGFVLLSWGLIWPGLAALAVGMGTVTTLMPIAARTIFGGQEYTSIWSILSAISNLGAMTAAPLFGLAFDLTGSYSAAMTAAAVLLIPALTALMASLPPERPA